ncbi:hypothetical protein F5X99DRAFT_367841 [Biscogniauxia marginata]|nr:hypothetical protein F5X99DRAFT_367841 [Biscogniauxia marginata]
MKTSVLLALLPAVLAAPNVMVARQDTTTTTSATTTASDLPCPITPANCAEREDGHLICLNSAVWCRYTDPARHTPAFFPVNLTAPCPSCLSSW